jgi:hypothetical protein
MLREIGNRTSPIYLLGDSNPKSEMVEQNGREGNDPLTPLDRRHPTRHNIWTPILDVVQRHVFVAFKGRLDDRNLYIRNAVEDPKDRVDPIARNREICALRDLFLENKPPLVLAFGRFSVEFALRALPGAPEPSLSWKVWNVKTLAGEFSTRIAPLTVPEGLARLESVNVIPLLHAVGALQFRYCHREFSSGRENYFEYVGEQIAAVLIKHRDHPKLRRLWM